MIHPTELIKGSGLGFMGMMVDPKYGGSGMDTLLCFRDGANFSSRQLGFCGYVGQQFFGLLGIETFGSEGKQKYLPDLPKEKDWCILFVGA